MAEASQVMHGNFDDRFGSGRIYIWREILKLVPDRLLLGGGPETLNLRTDASFRRYDADLNILARFLKEFSQLPLLYPGVKIQLILAGRGVLAAAAGMLVGVCVSCYRMNHIQPCLLVKENERYVDIDRHRKSLRKRGG